MIYVLGMMFLQPTGFMLSSEDFNYGRPSPFDTYPVSCCCSSVTTHSQSVSIYLLKLKYYSALKTIEMRQILDEPVRTGKPSFIPHGIEDFRCDGKEGPNGLLADLTCIDTYKNLQKFRRTCRARKYLWPRENDS
jgi:hypothetical protein